MRKRLHKSWWTPREKEVLRKAYPAWKKDDLTSEELSKLFKGRTIGSILNEATRLGLTYKEGSVDELYLKELQKKGVL